VLEEYWPEIGWPLICLGRKRSSTVEDVQRVFAVLDGKLNTGIAAPLYQSSESLKGGSIRRQRLKASKLNKDFFEVHKPALDAQQSRYAKHKRAQAGASQYAAVQMAFERAGQRLNELQEELTAAVAELDELSRSYRVRKHTIFRRNYSISLESKIFHQPWESRECVGRIARVEMAAILLTVFRNAIPGGTPPLYRIFEILQKIWNRPHQHFEVAPVEYFKTALLGLSKKYSWDRQYLWDNWRPLKVAIEASWDKTRPAESIPFYITPPL